MHVFRIISLTISMVYMSENKVSHWFNYSFFVLVVISIIVVFALVIFAPVTTGSYAPKAKFDQLKNNQTLTVNLNVMRSEENGISISEAAIAFDETGFNLSAILENEQDVPPVFLDEIPYNLDDLKDIDRRKALFFQSLLPHVLRLNEEILETRTRLMALKSKREMGNALNSDEIIWLKALANKYDSNSDDITDLVKRVDIVPPSLALAQAAEESGWGTSRFVREGNALFGQWTFDPKDKGIVPKGREEGKTHRIKAFDTIGGSLSDYMHNLNTHNAYKELREVRYQLRQNREGLNGLDLANTLLHYSERGEDYVSTLLIIIEQNNLLDFDETDLADDKAVRISA
jgi:Bax protein